MKEFTSNTDLTVIGGGLAGVCAAVAAARMGATVSLVQNRSLLGGNSSSEIRVWVVGATALGVQNFARETGIMGEMLVENQYTNPDGNPYHWDLIVLNTVRRESNIRLFLNTDVREVAASGDSNHRHIDGATGWQMGSERLIHFMSPAYIDATGDGLVGYLSGARYMSGRESKEEFGESWAPDHPDSNMLGSTLMFYSKDAGHPVDFIAPSWAKDITKTSIPTLRTINEDMRGCAYWWIEWGGDLDIVDDNEQIRDELQSVVFGIWDYIKNSGKFRAQNLTLEWAGSWPGKREYRRFVGDYVVTEQDIVGQTEFEDKVAFGGWSIDLHPVGGVYASEKPELHLHPDGSYHLPLRMLYSANVDNMWIAGRDVSASHVAFGGTRVMATCATLGEAAGIAATLCTERSISPRILATDELRTLQNALIRADASVVGLENADPADLARCAKVDCSSTLDEQSVTQPNSTMPLSTDIGMVIPITGRLEDLSVLLDATSETDLDVELHKVSKGQNYIPSAQISATNIHVDKGAAKWTNINFDISVDERESNVFLVFKKNPDISVYKSRDYIPGVIFFERRDPKPDDLNSLLFRDWKRMLRRESLCFRTDAGSGAFAATKAIGGFARPYQGPQMWCSKKMSDDSTPWIELTWDHDIQLHDLTVILDDEVDEDLTNLHRHYTPDRVMPGLVKDYELTIGTPGGDNAVIYVKDNRKRCVRHHFGEPITAVRLRLRVLSTNGSQYARVIAIRAY